MNLKGLLITVGTIFSAAFLSVGIVFLISFCSNIPPLQDAGTTKSVVELESTVAPLPSSIDSQPTSPAPTKDYSYPQKYITVDNSYFEKAVFLGDSRMQGFIKYCGIPKLRAYAYMGLTVEKYFSDQTFKIADSVFSTSEALELDRNFDKVYLMFGTNELGWAYPDIFIKKYTAVIDHIRECNPNAVIFVCSVIPVDQDAYLKKDYLKNDTVWSYNAMLRKLTTEKEAYYLDFAHLVANEEGTLPKEASTDGIHLNKEYVALCFDYMRSHAIETKPQEN